MKKQKIKNDEKNNSRNVINKNVLKALRSIDLCNVETDAGKPL